MKSNGKIILSAFVILVMIFSNVSFVNGAEGPLSVSTFSELKANLENHEGSNIILSANIIIPSNLGLEQAILIEGGTHNLNLNGFNIEYYYKNRANEYDGDPITIGNGKLTVSGRGEIKGGYTAVNVAGWDAHFVLNGSSLTALAATGIRTSGLTVINSGSLKGRFGEAWQEKGIIVDNQNIIKKLDKTFSKGNGAVIRNGVFTGNAVLNGDLTFKDLNITQGSSLSVGENGVLNVTGNLTGPGSLSNTGGIISIGGNYSVNKDLRIQRDVTLHNVTVEKGIRLQVNNANLSLSGDLVNNGSMEIDENSTLYVTGKLTNNGTLTVRNPQNLIVKGGIVGNVDTGEEDSDSNRNNGDKKENAANTLFILGLFQGTGMDERGQPVFDLNVKPNREVAITMLVRLLGKEREALSGNWSHPFKDVSSWADPYVGYAYVNGLTKGISSTEFGSTSLSDGNQYITFVQRALGYDDSKGDFSWDDPTKLSERIGLTMGDYRDNRETFLRGDVALLSERALHVKMKDKSTSLLTYLLERNSVNMNDVIKAGLN